MTHPHDRQKELDAVARRATVAGLMLSGVRGQKQIAAAVGVDQSTISRDIKAIEADWKKQAVVDLDEAKTIDLRRIDEAIRAVMPQVRKGHLSAVDRMVALLKRRADIFGYDSPKRTENTHTGADGAALAISIIRDHAPSADQLPPPGPSNPVTPDPLNIRNLLNKGSE